MTKFLASLFAFNRGLADPLFFGRPDIKSYALSAEEQTNIMPRVLGPASLRVGWEYKYSTYNNNKAYCLDFIFATDDTATIEFTDSAMRVDVDDAIITRPSVSTTISNGTFDSDLTDWTDNDESGATSAWATGGYMSLQGDGTNAAKRTQQVNIAGADQSVEHGLRITIQEGSATLKVGSTSGDDDYISESNLGVGVHSLTLSPTGDFYIEFSNTNARSVLVDSIEIESSGAMVLPSPYLEADLFSIRYAQSADVIYLACTGYQQRKIERRGTRSWSLVVYETEDGPFRTINTSPINLTPSALSGDVTITSSKDFFKSTNVGGLIKISSAGQNVAASLSAENTFSNSIKVTGVGASRRFEIVRSGTWTATVNLQRKIGEAGTWEDIPTSAGAGSDTTFTTNGSGFYADSDSANSFGLDNLEVFYRVGVKTGDYSSGTVELTMSYSAGSIDGVARITGYTDEQTVSAKTLEDFGAVEASNDWYEGAWSDRRGFPSAVALYEGRLYWAGKTYVWASVPDAYESFDIDVEGDSKPISRIIGSGPVDDINWLLPLQRLIVGTDGAEMSARSTSFDEPLTPTNFNLKNISTLGSNKVAAIVVDNLGYFVHRSGCAVYLLKFDSSNFTSLDYAAGKQTLYAPNAVDSPIVKMAVQRQPDTRLHCVREDGKVAVLVADPLEDVTSWIILETDGVVEDVSIRPSTTGKDDVVTYIVKRTINGSTVRYREKWAQENDCVGGTVNQQADSFVSFSQASSTTVSGLSHLEGEEVIVWADGVDYSEGSNADQTTYTVTAGAIELGTAVEEGVVGLPYRGRFKSTKLAYVLTSNGPLPFATVLTQRKRIGHVAFVARNLHYKGLKFGMTFDKMDPLPLSYKGAETAANTIYEDYDTDASTFRGGWETDGRICLEMHAPRPCTLLGVVMGMDVNEKK